MEQLVQVFGPLAVPTLICLAAGVLLLLIELFTPGFGVAGGLGLLLLAARALLPVCKKRGDTARAMLFERGSAALRAAIESTVGISLKKKKPNTIAATGSQEHRMDAFPASI